MLGRNLFSWACWKEKISIIGCHMPKKTSSTTLHQRRETDSVSEAMCPFRIPYDGQRNSVAKREKGKALPVTGRGGP
jgi:hypothetical protein